MPASGVDANLTTAQITRSYSSLKQEIVFVHEDAKTRFVFAQWISLSSSCVVFGALFVEA